MFSYTPRSLAKNGKPWFPIMGECHYSRVPKKFWKETLLKMKAGGVDIVSSYTIWIHHEEKEGEWDFSGQRDLRAFVKEVQNAGLYFFIRLGPWSHAEVRNGGFPDWLLHKNIPLRKEDPLFFAEVRKFYEKLFLQVGDLLHKNGGPIIGVQIENEYGLCGGEQGVRGDKYVRALTQLAKDVGFDVPLFTSTGWGSAVVGGNIPMMGGYVEAPWEQHSNEMPPNGNFLISHERNDHHIGSDYAMHTGLSFDITKYPFLTAELGGGNEPTYRRRGIPNAKDEGAMTLTKVASGCSLLGYYMYTGGANPKGKYSAMQECANAGSNCELPQITYDFFAPIGEYGKINDTYREIKLMTLFTHEWGNEISDEVAVIPQDSPVHNDDRRVRYSRRGNFLFVNNYVRHQKQDECQRVFTFDNKVAFPPISLQDGDYFVLPFNMKVGDGLLRTAWASPLCVLRSAFGANKKCTYVFYDCGAKRGCDDGDFFDWEVKPTDVDILLISREDALNSYKITRDGVDYLVVFDGALTDDGVSIMLSGRVGESQTAKSEKDGYGIWNWGKMKFKTYPALPASCVDFGGQRVLGGFVEYGFDVVGSEPEGFVSIVPICEDGKKAMYHVFVSMNCTADNFDDCNCFCQPAISDAVLTLHYNGSNAKLFAASEPSELIADDIFCSKDVPWKIGLRYLWERTGNFTHDFILEVDALCKDDDVYLEKPPRYDSRGVACSFVSARLDYEYNARVYF